MTFVGACFAVAPRVAVRTTEEWPFAFALGLGPAARFPVHGLVAVMTLLTNDQRVPGLFLMIYSAMVLPTLAHYANHEIFAM